MHSYPREAQGQEDTRRGPEREQGPGDKAQGPRLGRHTQTCPSSSPSTPPSQAHPVSQFLSRTDPVGQLFLRGCAFASQGIRGNVWRHFSLSQLASSG